MGKKRASKISRWLLRKIYDGCGQPALRFVLWDGTEVSNPDKPAAVLHIRNSSALYKLVINPEYYFGEGYVNGGLDVEGHMSTLLETIFLSLRQKNPSPYSAFRRALYFLAKRRRTNSLRGSRKNIHHHYDMGNDFYSLWLDKEMQYSGAYFSSTEVTLEDAQKAKMEYICRKLWLKPGDTVVDGGCGWGGLAKHMALNHGVRVRAFNISDEQIRFARERAKAEGWNDRVEFIQDDYRNITGKYDAFASVGALEHVDPSRFRELGHILHRCLNDSGRGLIQTIGRNRFTPMQSWMEKRIFPGAHPPSIREMMDIFEYHNFSILDVENLRLHYAQTVEHWLRRYEKNIDKITEMFDIPFTRTWRLYLASVIAGFNTGQLQLFQVVFSRPGNNIIPQTRAHLYTEQN